MQVYYIVIENKQEGPFSIEDLKLKNISSTTLVWREGFENWTEAQNIDELKGVFRLVPPPIPTIIKKPIIVKAEISKKKEQLIEDDTKILAAKEIKINFQIIFLGVLTGILSYPIILASKDGFSNWNMITNWNSYDKKLVDDIETNQIVSDLNKKGEFTVAQIESKRQKNKDSIAGKMSTELGAYDVYYQNKKLIEKEYKKLIEESKQLGWKENNDNSIYKELPVQYHKRMYDFATEVSMRHSFICFFISTVTIMIIRYFVNAAKWTILTSKKKSTNKINK